MNKTKHDAQHVPKYSAERETNRLSLCSGEYSKHMEKGASRAPRERLLSQWSIFTKGEKWGRTHRTCLVFWKGYKEGKEFIGSDKSWVKFL